ncbi:MAG: hypothetical protein HYX75_20020 [Acidobacteria bacterium]|nr:hypothetical protein [Acidobacteriota bacterium]
MHAGEQSKKGLLVSAALILAVSGRAAALDPAKAITQYIHRSWQTEHGLPQNSVGAIVQTHDGYIWLGTEEGLVRFDGLSFKIFEKRSLRALKNNFITALVEDRSGALWIGTRGGLVRWKDEQARAYTIADGLPSDFITALAVDFRGRVWIATNGGGVTCWSDESMSTYSGREGLSDPVMALWADREGSLWIGTEHNGLLRLGHAGITEPVGTWDGAMGSVKTICGDPAGGLWLGTSRGLVHYDSGRYGLLPVPDALRGIPVRSLCRDRVGSLWIGTQKGLGCLRGSTMTTYTSEDGLSDNTIMSLLEDREGSLWIGTNLGGLNQLADAKFTTYGRREGLSNDIAYPILEDRSGNLWIGTDGGGLNLFKDNNFVSLGRREGLPSDTVFSLAEDSEGDVWLGTRSGLCRLRDGRITPVTLLGQTREGLVMAICAARDGSLWAGIFGVGLAHMDHGRQILYTTRDGLPSTHITGLHEDRKGRLWVGTSGGGVAYMQRGIFTTYSERDGLPSNVVFSFFEDADGCLWLGTGGGGLCRFDEGAFETIGQEQGLFDDTVLAMVPDGHGDLWMSCNKGVFRVTLADLHACIKGLRMSVFSVSYGLDDGMRSAECNGHIQPAGFRTRTGEIWFPTVKGVVRINPAAIPISRDPPPLSIPQVVVDDREVEAAARIDLPAGWQRVEIHYAGLSFVAPSRVQFKYMLEGFDHGWVNAGTRRIAQYTNLPPGEFRFRVTACNHDGVWNREGASLIILKRPYFYQTVWFHIAWIFTLLLLIASGHVLRVRQFREREKELARRVEAALAKVKILSGLLPICSWCKKVRDDNGYWNQLESYLHEHTEADFSHSICPECMAEHFPSMAERIQRDRVKESPTGTTGPAA